jgi:hypothetical protein
MRQSRSAPRRHVRREPGAVLLGDLRHVRHEHLTDRLAAIQQTGLGGHEDQLRGFQLLDERHGHAIRVDAIRLAVPVEAERRHHRHDPLIEHQLELFHVDPLDLAGKKMIDALNDAHRVSDDAVDARRAKVVCRQPLQDLVGEPGRGGDREVERRSVGDAGAVVVRRLDMTLSGERTELRRRPVHHHDADVQRPQEGDVEEQGREVVVSDDVAVEPQDEGLFAELRNVMQDAAQIGEFHC